MISKSTKPHTAESAYLYALRILALRDYSVATMRRKLSARGVCESDAEETVARLLREGWLDDRRYAERFAESALSSGRFFGQRLRIEMRRRGFEAALIDEILGRLQENLDEEAEIRNILERRYPGFQFTAATDREKRRIIGYLQRRGFGLSMIIRALKAVGQD